MSSCFQSRAGDKYYIFLLRFSSYVLKTVILREGKTEGQVKSLWLQFCSYLSKNFHKQVLFFISSAVERSLQISIVLCYTLYIKLYHVHPCFFCSNHVVEGSLLRGANFHVTVIEHGPSTQINTHKHPHKTKNLRRIDTVIQSVPPHR